MGRVIGAAIAGYVAIGILVVCTDQVYALLVPGFKSLPMPPTYYFALSLLTDFIYSILGGYLCAWIAGALARKATLGLIVGGRNLGRCIGDRILEQRAALVRIRIADSLSACRVARFQGVSEP